MIYDFRLVILEILPSTLKKIAFFWLGCWVVWAFGRWTLPSKSIRGRFGHPLLILRWLKAEAPLLRISPSSDQTTTLKFMGLLTWLHLCNANILLHRRVIHISFLPALITTAFDFSQGTAEQFSGKNGLIAEYPFSSRVPSKIVTSPPAIIDKIFSTITPDTD